MKTTQKEIFVDMVMDLLIVIDLDGVSEDKEKENRMRTELLGMSDQELGDKYNQSWDLFKKQSELKSVDKILEEIKDIGVEAVRERYGIS